MPTQTIGTIKVVVNNQDTGAISVRQSNQFDSKVRSLSYGQPLELGKAVDLTIDSTDPGSAITYNAASGIFHVAPVTANNAYYANTAVYANTANTVISVAGGTF